MTTPKSGHTGVRWTTWKQAWQARINVRGKARCLGYFADINDAIAARLEAEKRWGKPKQENRT